MKKRMENLADGPPKSAPLLKEMFEYSHLLSKWGGESFDTTIELTLDPDRIIELGHQTKTIGLLPKCFMNVDFSLPADVLEKLNADLTLIEAQNFKNLVETTDVASLLTDSGIDHLVFKGPVQSHRVYKIWNARRCADIDVLVPFDLFRSARDVLNRNGYRCLIEQNNVWWRRHLGELPFKKTSKTSLIIDLHHQVQQPGGPYPKNLNGLFLENVETQFGRHKIKIPNTTHALLISVIGYGKSVRACTPWLHYAHEIFTTLQMANEKEKEAIAISAKTHGLLRLYEEASTNAHKIFRGMAGHDFEKDEYEDLLSHAFGSTSHPRFFRTRKLWDWTDGPFPSRLKSFTRGINLIISSEIARLNDAKKS